MTSRVDHDEDDVHGATVIESLNCARLVTLRDPAGWACGVLDVGA